MKTVFLLAAILTSVVTAQQNSGPWKFDEIADVPDYYCTRCHPDSIDRIKRFVSYARSLRSSNIFVVHYRARVRQGKDRHSLRNLLHTLRSELTGAQIYEINGGIRDSDSIELWVGDRTSSAPPTAPTYAPADAVDCPEVYISQEELQFGETIKLKAVISPAGTYGLEWTVDKGTIKGDTHKDTVSVDYSGVPEQKGPVSLRLSGVPAPCVNSYSMIGEGGKTSRRIDAFESIANGDFKARLDNFFITLNTDPELRGYVYLYGARTGQSKDVKRVKTRFVQFAMFRRYDLSRVKLVEAGFKEDQLTEFWIAPPDASPPKPQPTVDPRFLTVAKKRRR